MKCLMNNKEVKHPCSPACALFGDCVTAFAHHKEENPQPTAGSQHEEASVNEKLAYEQYKLQWKIDHGFTLTDLIECLEIMIREDTLDGGDRKDLQTLFEAREFGVGFIGGQIWPCLEEFRGDEIWPFIAEYRAYLTQKLKKEGEDDQC